jgi:hypothetical protein
VRGKSLLRQLVVANKITSEALEKEDEPQNILDPQSTQSSHWLMKESGRVLSIKHPAERVMKER